MRPILEFLNQPIVLTLVTLVVGSYLLSIVAERRSRRDRLKDKSIEFLTEAGSTINAFVPLIYSQLRTYNLAIDQAIQDGMRDLFSARLGIHIGSKAYLKSEKFARQYFKLLDELAAVVEFMSDFEQAEEQEETLAKVRARRERLLTDWQLEGETPPPDTGPPVDELIWMMDLILHRATALLSEYLERVMG
jgi:hypothetical protein